MTVATSLLGKRSQEVALATRATMLDAALSAFADQGFEATSLRAVADTAGVTHALFRKHFGSKEEVWQACVDHGLTRYASALRERAARGDRPITTIKDQVRILLDVTAAHPALVRMMVLEGVKGGARSEYLSDAWHKIGDEHRSRFHDAQWECALRPFFDSDLFLFILTSGMIPLALPALSNSILHVDIEHAEEREKHIERLCAVLFPQNASAL